jgi:hypothetical protein
MRGFVGIDLGREPVPDEATPLPPPLGDVMRWGLVPYWYSSRFSLSARLQGLTITDNAPAAGVCFADELRATICLIISSTCSD